MYVTFVSLKQRGMLVENNHSISLVAHFVMLQPYSELMDYIYFSPQEFYTQHPLITFFLSGKGLLVAVSPVVIWISWLGLCSDMQCQVWDLL